MSKGLKQFNRILIRKKSCYDRSFQIAKNYDLSQKGSFQWKIKRMIDVISSFLGLVCLSPLFLLIAIAIKLDSPGPVFYKQKRIGYLGKKFYMYKFRSMRKNAERERENLKMLNETNEVMFKLFNDPRVTKVGKFIRKHSLDELPQLFNVLLGDMSLVGPRPPIVSELKSYKPWHYVRFSSLPGITGIWQTSGRSRIKKFDNVVKLDFDYIKNWNILLDIKLLLKTIPIVILGKDTA